MANSSATDEAARAQTLLNAPEKGTRIETLAAIVLSIAAVATAWSAYQSTRWSGEMATSFNQAGALRSESVRATTEAGQLTLVDVTIAADWLSALLSGNHELAREFRKRMPPELDDAMNRWLGTWQVGEPIPDGGPFADGGYVAPGTMEAVDLERRAEASFKAARQANQHSDNYVLTGVLFALSLFFAGISSRVNVRSQGEKMVFGAAALMAAGILVLVLQPKSIGI